VSSVLTTHLLFKSHFEYGKYIAGFIEVSSKDIILLSEYLPISL
jgi:hypothetical protein